MNMGAYLHVQPRLQRSMEVRALRILAPAPGATVPLLCFFRALLRCLVLCRAVRSCSVYPPLSVACLRLKAAAVCGKTKNWPRARARAVCLTCRPRSLAVHKL